MKNLLAASACTAMLYMATSMTISRLGPAQFLAMSDLQQGSLNALGKPGPYGDSFDFDGTSGSSRIGNSIKYQSPAINGLTAGMMHGFSNVAGGFSNGNAYSMGIDYVQSAFALNAAYRMVRYPSINNGANGIQNFGLGGRVAVLNGWFDFMYTNTRNTFTSATISVGEIGATIPITGTTHAYATYQYMKGNAVLQNNRAHQASLIHLTSLSRRTDVCVGATYQHASRDGDTAQAWIFSNVAPSSTGNQTIMRVGMRFFF
ncbi:porin [Paraburkholderia xenovorans]|jgi:predicted porin